MAYYTRRIRLIMLRLLVPIMCAVLSLCLLSCGQAAEEQTAGDKSSATGQELQGGQGEFNAREYYAELLSCKEQIEAVTDFKPEIVLVLGTGLNGYADDLDVIETIPYSSIEGWPVSTAPNHKGRLIFAEYEGLKLAIMQGRVHCYEGYSVHDVVKPLRVLHLLGADTVILTNAVGAINTDYKVGDFVCVEDHISSFVPSPLVGENIDELGERFTPMDDIYDAELREIVFRIGEENNIPVHSGVFVQTMGPQFETPAEIKMYKELGADTVGMSTAVEAIAAAHMGMRICAINSVTNMAAGIEDFDTGTISGASEESSDEFKVLMDELLKSIATSK